MRLQDQYPFPQASSQLKERESQGPRARQPTRRAEVKRQKYQVQEEVEDHESSTDEEEAAMDHTSVVTQSMLSTASSLRDHAAFFQSETMRPANDPKERDPSHVRMLNDVLRDLEKSFILPQTPPGVYR
ncbi:hypothetical protein KUCAC02_022729 [Chaenocephalus aceratus]|uniref:Uncharacterized protein n=1 Tax=Chaenocephalus aceratus TaxID=36190 RepID=A0ACB9XPP4_CHAAC|nr:hypothetical protein KUCAC02_022729 [Chaenocephalus aceratus]